MPAQRPSLLGPLPPFRGGIAQFHHAVAQAYQARGAAVDRVTFARQYPAWLFPGKSQLEPGAAGEAARLLDPLNPLAWRRAVRHVEVFGADLAVVPYWLSFFAPMWRAVTGGLRRRGIPTVAIVHNALPHERRWGDAAAARLALGACRGLVVLSESVRDDLHRLGVALPTELVAHPTYDQFGAPPPAPEARAALGLRDAPTLLFFGFVRPYKGLDVLLDAFPEIQRRVPAVQLVVAGEVYEGEAALRAQAAPFGDAVRFDADYIASERVPLYFGAADLVVQPYVSATQSGVARLAFGLGTPVLTTDVGGLAEAVPDGVAGRVVPPGDAAALAAAAAEVLLDPALRARLAAGARALGASAGWEPILAAIDRLASPAMPR